jgi:hypothetical protein
MHPNEQTLTRFYTAFAALDADTMASCYAEDATFTDPAFSLFNRRDIGGMWHMLCAATQAKNRQDWRLEFRDVQADNTAGRAHWEAHYRFSVSNRLVHNIIEAEFTFNPEGLIASHKDSFDFWRWSRQALGMGGWVLGWSERFRKQVKTQTHAALTNYLAKHP